MISTRNGRRGRCRARTRARSTRRAVCRALPSSQPAWALEGGLGGWGACIGGVGGGVSVEPRRFFMEAPLSGTWVVRGRAGAGKRVPEGSNTPFRARGVAFLALLWHLNAKATPRGACAWVFYFRAGFRFPLVIKRNQGEGGRGGTSGWPAGVVPEVAITTPGTATRPDARGHTPRAARPPG